MKRSLWFALSFVALAHEAGASQSLIAAGVNFSCAVQPDKTVKCWGQNNLGQLGDGTLTERLKPTTVPALADVIAITSGDSHACALKTNGSVWCWGQNDKLQVGAQVASPAKSPVQVAPGTSFKQLDAGADHVCGVTIAGGVVCWGANSVQQAGQAASVSVPPTALSTPYPAISVAAGENHTCGVFDLGATNDVMCWGANDVGQLGRATTGSPQFASTTAYPFTNATVVAVGSDYSCANDAGSLYCWGKNNRQQLGSTASGPVLIPTGLTLEASAVSIAAGAAHACASFADGSARCWGANELGQLGDGSYGLTGSSSSPVPVKTAGITQLAGGTTHTCAVLGANEDLACWGSNVAGELGIGWKATSSLTPKEVPGVTDATSISAGEEHTCARLADGSVNCWGANLSGQLGRGSRGSIGPKPSTVIGLYDATSVGAGANHTCAASASGAVACWGANNSGQVSVEGGDQFDAVAAPKVVPGVNGVNEIRAGVNHTCAIGAGDLLQCWGGNYFGQLGRGYFSEAQPPGPGPSEPTLNLASGESHNCMRSTDSKLSCWGDNSAGQTTGVNPAEAEPIMVAPENAAKVDAFGTGRRHTCAARSGGIAPPVIQCWGSDANGQLGNGATTGDKNTPQFVRIATPLSLSLGMDSTCSIEWTMGARTVWCWGDNSAGQFGNGATGIVTSPINVPALAGAYEIVFGKRHACFLTGFGTVKCMGNNDYGQLGDGRSAFVPTPVRLGDIFSDSFE